MIPRGLKLKQGTRSKMLEHRLGKKNECKEETLSALKRKPIANRKNFKGTYLETEMVTEAVIKCVWMENWWNIWGKEHRKVKA